ncbi:hypothetical protein WJX73_008807 [Symbiochloris irregularis]|uniref:Myb-like domain-containing protein n=1 Tax=Symbiochloris irregularis TaxID=706552 RepID=A0AAW1P0W0_9CHLO
MVQPKRQSAAQAPAQQRPAANGAVPAHIHGEGHMHAGANATLRMDKRSGSLKAAASDAMDSLEGNQDTEAQKQAREEQLVARAVEARAIRATLALAYERPNPEPARCLDQQGALLKEMRWLSLDFQQERIWKQAAARKLAYAAAESRPVLRSVTCAAAKEIREAHVAEEQAALQERKSSGRHAGPSHANHHHKQQQQQQRPGSGGSSGSHGTPLTWKPTDPLRFRSVFAAHIQELADNRFIKQEQAIRDYDDEYEAARKAVAEAADQAASREATGALPAAAQAEDAALALDSKSKRQKKGRLPKHLEDFAAVRTPHTAAPPSPARTQPTQPTRSLNRSTGAPAAEAMAVEEEELPLPLRRTDRKKRRRDYDDEDYEEPRLRDRRRPPPEPQRRPPPTAQGAASNLRDRNLRNKRNLSQRDASYAAAQPSTRRPTVVPPPWSPQEEQLLAAIVFEFGANWGLVSDIFSSTTLVGVYRRPEACRERFRITQRADEKVVTPRQEHELVLKRMDKGQARSTLLRALPVPEGVLQSTQHKVLQVMLNHQHKSQQDKRFAEGGSRGRAEVHPSHIQVQQSALTTVGGRFMAPTELADLSDAHHAAQHAAAQQAAAQQQAAAAAAAAAQQHAAAAQQAQAAAQQGAGAGVRPPGAVTAPSPGALHPPMGAPPMASMHPPVGSFPQLGTQMGAGTMQAMGPPMGHLRSPTLAGVPPNMGPGGMSGVPMGAGRPPLPQTSVGSLPPGMPASSLPGMLPGSFPMGPGGVRPPGVAGARPTYPVPGVAGVPGAGMQARPQNPLGNLSGSQIQHILATGKLPDGRELTQQWKNHLMARLRTTTHQHVGTAAAAPRGIPQGAPGMPGVPGRPPGAAPGVAGLSQQQAQAAMVRASMPQSSALGTAPPQGMGAVQGLRPPMGAPHGYTRPPAGISGLPGSFPNMMAGLAGGPLTPQMQAQLAAAQQQSLMRPGMMPSYASQQPPAITGTLQQPPGGQ